MFQTQGQMMEQAEEGNEEDDNLEDPEFEASEKFIECAGDVLLALGSDPSKNNLKSICFLEWNVSH
jgi:hypothetical protein